MIDIRTEEEAALYVLDLLNGRDRQAFEARLEREADLSDYVRKLADDTALLALNAPRLAVPPNAYARISQAIQTKPKSQPKNVLVFINRMPAAWPMAACLMLSFTVLLLLAERTSQADLRHAGIGAHSIPGITFDLQNRLDRLAALEKAQQKRDEELRARQTELEALEDQLENTRDEVAIKEREKLLLLRKLQKMAELEVLYRNAGPGVARLTVIDLTDGPAIPNNADAYTGLKKPDGDYTPNGSMQRDRPLAASFLRGGEAANSAPLPANPDNSSQAIPASVPLVTGLVPMDDSLVAATTGTNTSFNLSDDNQPTGDNAESPYAPSGTVIYDEKGNGKLLLWDVPSPGEGYAYKAWLVDPQLPNPVLAGTIDHIDKGTDSFVFATAEKGITPTKFFITKESANGGNAPKGEIILSSDWNAAKNP